MADKEKKLKVKKTDAYGADSLKVLRFPDNIRKRPSMYVGGVTADTGLFRLFSEAFDNILDEAMNGHGTRALVSYNTKTHVFVVCDRGRGIPTGMNKKEGKSSLELALTSMHGSGKFDQANYTASAGMNGIGLKAVTALSEYVNAYSANEGVWKSIHLKRGIVSGPVVKETPKLDWAKKASGTIIEWKPDTQIFGTEEVSVERMRRSISYATMLNPGFSIEFVVDGKSKTYVSENGLLDMIYGTDAQKQLALVKPFQYLSKSKIDIALVWHDDDLQETWSFVNSSNTPEEGTHVQGARNAILEALRNEMDSRMKAASKPAKGKKEDAVDAKYLLMGMRMALNWRMVDPMFSGQTKDKLTSSDAVTAVKNVVLPEFSAFLKKNPKLISTLIDRAKKFQKAAEKFQQELKAVKTIKLNAPNARGILPGKLAQARGKFKPEQIELFLVEGESAAGPAKEVRLPHQEVLELRGKVLNAARTSFSTLLGSDSVMNIITSMGARPGDDCKTTGGSVRVGKVFIMTDADPDGDHICSLLSAMFVKYFRPWLDEVRIAHVQVPLFVGALGDRKEFGFTLDSVLAKFPEAKRKNVLINRLKGLGEFTNSELFEFGMNPETRRLKYFTVSDADVVEVGKIMGNEEENEDYRKKVLGITAKGAR